MKKLQSMGFAAALCAASAAGQDNGGQIRIRETVRAEVALQILNATRTVDATLTEAFAGPAVKGRPVSATETRKTTQTLANGAHIENSESNRLFRDTDGRTRVEGRSSVTIADPVAGFQAILDPATKTARQSAGGRGGRGGGGGRGVPVAIAVMNPANGKSDEVTETLPSQLVNGVLAQGTRTTLTIPKGQIGNDRDIKVVSERWYSNDLQMMIKSTNSDPRFGDTTYELTNIVTLPPDPALFQIPAGYTGQGSGIVVRGVGRSN